MLSFPPLSNICDKMLSHTQAGLIEDSTLRVGSLPYPQIQVEMARSDKRTSLLHCEVNIALLLAKVWIAKKWNLHNEITNKKWRDDIQHNDTLQDGLIYDTRHKWHSATGLSMGEIQILSLSAEPRIFFFHSDQIWYWRKPKSWFGWVFNFKLGRLLPALSSPYPTHPLANIRLGFK